MGHFTLGLLATLASVRDITRRGIRKLPNAERPCIVCHSPHRHNQPFCSAKCQAEHGTAPATEPKPPQRTNSEDLSARCGHAVTVRGRLTNRRRAAVEAADCGSCRHAADLKRQAAKKAAKRR